MNRISSITLGILLSLLVAGDAAAQWNVARLGTEPNRVYATFGLDPALVASLGYGRVVPLLGHDFQLVGEVGLAAAELDTRDFRVRTGVQTALLRLGPVHLTGSAMGIARGTENSIYRGYNFGADLTAALGVYRPGWFIAGEFGKDKAVITHLTHSDWYRTVYYPDAKDGWYLDASGTYHYGLTGGLALGRAEVVGRFGWHRTERFNELSLPVYASVGVGYGF